ncbi:uncharacterized protein LOC132181637 [Corylus avellana]|uniref:uncharacterized protein LOC132181637 n=1 Tax=Corylus avellana TaxID=13451 RepID=UPI00286C8186|nr:uncharacterized protein LOC132181637 [Corylus avellana]
MNFPLPDKFKMPHVDKYDGKGDPMEHMESLRAHFIVHGTPDEISCRAFPLTLAEAANEWSLRLSTKSMDNFKSLGCLFLSQFLVTCKRKKSPAYLLSLVQRKDEFLKNFMLRFNKEKLTVESPSEQKVLNALMHGVRAEGPLMAELVKESTMVTLLHFLKKAEEYINQEEIVVALMKSQEKVTQQEKSGVKAAPMSSGKKQERNPKQQDKRALKPKNESLRKFSKFIPSNTSMTKVLMEIWRDPNFRWPTRLKGPASKRDHTKFCHYHNEVGHLTEECVSLRHEIESFIRNGKLVRFLAGERARGRDHLQPLLLEGNREAEPRPNWDAHPPPQNHDVVGEILTISGGIAGGGESNSAKKAHARRVQTEEVLFLERPAKTLKREPMVLSFSEEDAKGVMMPHDDALVVTVTVANHVLYRILVDNGSSTDILYWPVFKQMVETAPRQSIIMVDFLVVDRPSAYNVIIGWLALNKLKVVTSTYHLKMKFSTEEGVGEVKGDLIVARKCYITSLKKPSEAIPLTVSTVRSKKEG